MPVRNVDRKTPKGGSATAAASGAAGARGAAAERYRRLPTGTHGLDPEEVQRDQRARLRTALIELIARRGYRAVRIVDVTKLARVSRPTFYSLYADKEALFLDAYDEISGRAARTVMEAYEPNAPARAPTRCRYAPSARWPPPSPRRCRCSCWVPSAPARRRSSAATGRSTALEQHASARAAIRPCPSGPSTSPRRC